LSTKKVQFNFGLKNENFDTLLIAFFEGRGDFSKEL
jgi:hypothetical protein